MDNITDYKQEQKVFQCFYCGNKTIMDLVLQFTPSQTKRTE